MAGIGKNLANLFKYRFNLDSEKAEENEIIDAIKKNIEFKGTNLWTLIFAIFIASIGLNVNSTAVIIGAMLISPLMGPIMGIGLGIGIFDFELIKNALKNLFIAVVISLIASSLYFYITPLQEARSELLSRTTPTIWDVLIALFGGLAGIIASSRKSISNAIPGVAIATALMPPLCTAGYGIGTGNFYYFIGAFYLFVINCVFISISTFLIVRFLKFKAVQHVDKTIASRVKKYVLIIAVCTILPSIYLAYRFVKQEIFTQNAQNFINKEVKQQDLFIIDKTINANTKTLKLVIYGERLNDSLSDSIIAHKRFYGLKDADISIQHTLNSDKKLTDLREAKANINAELENQLIEKDDKIRSLELKLNAQLQTQIKDSLIYNEFHALFGKTKELLISKTFIHNEADTKDTVVFVYYSEDKHSHKINEIQLEDWLKVRMNTKNIKIISK